MKFTRARVATPPRWFALGPLLVLVLLSPFAAFGADKSPSEVAASLAVEAPVGSAVLRIAILEIGTHQGECFPWVRRVVQRATGHRMGYDYRAGYLEAGAIEVPLASARGGDIIQLISDADDSANADYPGMHTAIVLNAESPGVFRVIDSNLAFDGMVRVREGYNPMALAARFPNINVHVYRFHDIAFTGGAPEVKLPNPVGSLAPTGPAIVGAPPSPVYQLGSAISQLPPTWPLPPEQAATTAIVRADGDCLRLRAAPTAAAPVLTCIPDGSVVTLLQGTEQADGVVWQSVNAGGRSGWVSSQYLASGATAAPVPVPPSSPAPAVAAPAPVVNPPAPLPVASVEGAPAVIGDLPARGGLALVVYSGGPTAGLFSAVSQRGCSPVSVWASRSGGGLVGMIPGAPAVVNREWRDEFPADSLAARTPLIVVCGGAGGAPVASVAAAPPPTAAGPAPAVVRAGTTPPGPAGNE